MVKLAQSADSPQKGEAMQRQGFNSVGEELSGVRVAHPPVRYADNTPSMTRQEFAAECDINVLMAHYEKNAIMPPVNGKEPSYFDASAVPDFREALDIAREAGDAFMRIPAAARKELDNDVYKFVEYCKDPENTEQLRKWGLVDPVPVEAPPMRVEVVNPPSAPPAE